MSTWKGILVPYLRLYINSSLQSHMSKKIYDTIMCEQVIFQLKGQSCVIMWSSVLACKRRMPYIQKYS